MESGPDDVVVPEPVGLGQGERRIKELAAVRSITGAIADS
jgi:hypothetical protein